MESLLLLNKDLNEYYCNLNIIKQNLSQRKINYFSCEELEIIINNGVNINEKIAAINNYKLSCLKNILN